MQIALVLSFLLCLFNGLIFAQVGSVEGFISDNDKHQSLSGANIQINSLSLGAYLTQTVVFSSRKFLKESIGSKFPASDTKPRNSKFIKRLKNYFQ
jgi:hypothetical protein